MCVFVRAYKMEMMKDECCVSFTGYLIYDHTHDESFAMIFPK